MSIDTLRTAAQFMKNLRVNWAYYNLMPGEFVDSVCDISPAFLRKRGIEGIVWDVDNTLMEYHGTAVDPSVRAAHEELCSFPQVVLSNSDEKRYCELGRVFPDVPVLRAYEGRTGRLRWHGFRAYRRLFGGYSTLDSTPGFNSSREVRAIHSEDSDGLHPRLKYYRALRKPNPDLFRYAQKELGIDDPKKVAVIGDRASTDISGGNQAGMYTIKVAPLRPETEPASGMVGRWCEVGVMAWHAYRLRQA